MTSQRALSVQPSCYIVVQQVFLIWAFSQLGECGKTWALVKTELFAAMKLLAPTKPQTTPVPSPGGEAPPSVGQVNPFLLPPQQAYLAWTLGQPLSMHVHFSTSPNGDVFSRQWTSGWREDQDKGLPSFVWSNITFGDWNEHRTEYFDITLPEVWPHCRACTASHPNQAVQRNASLWADIFLTKEGASPDPSNPSFDAQSVHHIRKRWLISANLPIVAILPSFVL